MRALSISIICWCFVQCAALAADDAFPYTAKVAVDKISVRCGPAQQYYTTQTLKRGESVRVYRHDSNGWLAVRPPTGSFSWVAARRLKATDDPRISEIAVDGTVAWVGADSVEVEQHKWQVRLDRGELVEVLGKRPLRIGSGTSTETYIKIAPPAGEFRWIRAKQAGAALATVHRGNGGAIQLADYRAADRNPEDPADSADRDADRLAREIDQLKVELSLLVTRNIEAWNLESLERRISELDQVVRDAPMSREIHDISERMDEFRTLQQRHRQVSEFVADAEPIERPGVSAAPQGLKGLWHSIDLSPVGTGVAPSSEARGTARQADEISVTSDADGSTFDADGWLVPVHSAKRIAPPFALLDDDGRVRCYVQPAPGLNLRRYVRKQVGIIGQLRKVPALRASLVTAERVVKISKR